MDFVLNDKSEMFMYSNEEEYNAHFIRKSQIRHFYKWLTKTYVLVSRKQPLNLCLVLSFTDNQFV